MWEAGALAVWTAVLALGSTWAGSRWQVKADRARRQEDKEREDRFRLHEGKVDAYTSFFAAAGPLRRSLRGLAAGYTDETSARRDRRALWETYTRVRLLGDKPVVDRAWAFMKYADKVRDEGGPFDDDYWDKLVNDFVEVARISLGAAEKISHKPDV